MLPLPEPDVFECQGCGLLIEGWPQGDCETCGCGHWTAPPTHRFDTMVDPKAERL